MDQDETVRTTRGMLWKQVLWSKSVVSVTLFVLFASTASFVWDEVFAPLFPSGPQRQKLIQVLRWLPWYAWSLLGFGLIIVFAVERAHQLISAAEARAEESNAKMYDGRPLFVLEVLRSGRQWDFRLRNCGDRTARYVKLNSIPSRGEKSKYVLHFQEIPAMPKGSEAPLFFWVSELFSTDTFPLSKFLNEHSPDAALIWWDIRVKFRDVNEAVEDGGIVRLCFEVESGVLYSTCALHCTRLQSEQVRLPLCALATLGNGRAALLNSLD
jgi:hypothetical protein